MLVSRVRRILLGVCALSLGHMAIAHPGHHTEGEENDPIDATVISSAADADRLRNLEGLTLQWISWDDRGEVSVMTDGNGVWYLSGTQFDQDGSGLQVSGIITEIGEDYFLLDGRVIIGDTPDIGRACEGEKVWRFEVTQNRTYYRLREFGWCDDLTDYVDIYFDPRLR